MISYLRTKEFTEKQVGGLFLSVGWVSGEYPQKLVSAFRNSGRVISAWEGEKLAGLIRGLDDGAWQATIDCLLVRPEYQGMGIASSLLKMLMDDYKDMLYINVTPEEKKNVGFYLKHGFEPLEEGTPLQHKGAGWNTGRE